MGAVKEYYHHKNRILEQFDDRVLDEWKVETKAQKIRDYFKKKGIK